MIFQNDGTVDEFSIAYQPAAGPPWSPGDVIEIDRETGIGRMALNSATTREELILSDPMQLSYPRHVMDVLDKIARNQRERSDPCPPPTI